MAQISHTFCGPADGGNFEYQWADNYLKAHYISDVGKKRQHNEDSCIICAPEDAEVAEERGILFAVADGMGGASAGEFASRLALQTIIEDFYSGELDSIPVQLRSAVERANERIFQEAENNPQYHGMGTTVSALLVRDDCAYIAQVGDSRVYISRDNSELLQVTQDHSLVAEQVRNGIISEEEARHHSLKNLITRAVGIKEGIQVDLFCFRLKRGDTILICSDGLCNVVTDEDIADTLQMDNLQAAARVLVGKALEGGGSDNISVAIVRVAETPPKRGALQEGCESVTMPSAGLIGKIKKLLT